MSFKFIRKGLVALWLGLILTSLSAQPALNVVGKMYIESGAQVYADGDVAIDAGAYLTSPGDIEVTGDWDNQGTYAPQGQGRITFSGGSSSTLSGNMTAQSTFYRFYLDKSSGTAIRITSDMHVDDTLYLHGGLIQTLSNEVYLTSQDTGLLTGYPLPGASVDDRYILGNLRRALGTTQAQYDFPVGTAPSQAGYQLLRFRPLNLMTTTNLLVNYQNTTGYTAPMTSECGATYDCMLSGIGQWQMVPNGTSPRFDLTLVPRKFSVACGGGSYTVLTSGSLNGTACTGYSGTLATVSGTEITRKFIDSPGPFTITGSATSFPVEWLSFEAWPEGNVAQLEWITAHEESNDYFQVERSADGQNFAPIGQVESFGDSNSPVDYQFTDHAPLNGRNYYRLRQVDLDGQFSFSSVKEVWFDGPQLGIWPNPFVDRITIRQHPQPDMATSLILYNGLGQIVADKTLEPIEQQSMDLSHLPEGTYTYRLIQNGQQVSIGKLVRISQ